ncbi:MAG: glycoside hydrolase [Thaumarchaeota archaeon]|nr:glycoside hydrolase [Nitrososphaerota archaeon]
MLSRPVFKNFNKRKMTLTSFFIFGLLLLANPLILSTSATTHFKSAPVFLPAKNLSNDSASAKDPTVSNHGQNVYVAWSEGKSGILFRMSPDGGVTWNPPLTKRGLVISPAGGTSQFPVMFTQFQRVPSGVVYVTWAQSVRQANGTFVLQIFVAASINNGISFNATQISHNSTHPQITPAIGAEGSHVFVAWYSGANATTPGSVYAASSLNNGSSWGSAKDVINPDNGGEPEIVASGGNAYLTSDGIYFSASYTNGKNWTVAVEVYNDPPNTNTSVYYGREPWIAANGSKVYVTWEANSTTSGIGYHDQGVTSIDGGKTWGPEQNLTEPLIQSWEPQNGAYGNNTFLTFHDLKNQGVYVRSATGVNSSSPSWGALHLLSKTALKASFAHIYSSDGVNVFVMWGQQISSQSSTWNAYVSYSGDSGSTWSSSQIDISNNAVGQAAAYNDVTLFGVSSNGAHCFAAWTYTNGPTSQIYFATS